MAFGVGIIGGLLTLCLYYVGLFVLGKLWIIQWFKTSTPFNLHILCYPEVNVTFGLFYFFRCNNGLVCWDGTLTFLQISGTFSCWEHVVAVLCLCWLCYSRRTVNVMSTKGWYTGLCMIQTRLQNSLITILILAVVGDFSYTF